MSSKVTELRTHSLTTQLLWYFGGLIAVYAAALVAFWPSAGQDPNQAIFFALMFAPTAGALRRTCSTSIQPPQARRESSTSL